MSKKRPAPKPPAKQLEQEDDFVTACRKCGSTNHSPHVTIISRDISGIHEGREFNVVDWRDCECLDCGQWRRDVIREMRIG